ncbi:MAG TPA: PilZ domain-containing protein [Pyrinomonadaceae bacterium]|nr:PilZ domain-containing protein [Pyrinomonadaceae bacterium]
MKSHAERRALRRARGYFHAEWELPEGREAGFVRDISEGGCYVQSGRKVAVGSPIRIVVEMPSGRWIKALGVVAHRGPAGFGVRFRDVGETARGEIEAVLRDLHF